MDRLLFDRIYATVAKKENTYDGIYYTCVKTTKIFCRPSCRARTPYPQNVTFVTSVSEAIRAGFRPCKRCKPEEPGKQGPDERLAARVDEMLERQLDRPVTLRSLAAELSISPFHLQRLYKRVTGHTPAEQLHHIRLREARRRLELGIDTMAGIADAVGFRSPSHFTAWFKREVGKSPSEYRAVHLEGDKRT
ncbi:Ada metal-binding domain-containing protein [Paenibacillus thermotolerans]|uniref:Ada metal-binding domain-containing protein n=1 Tax=Paenibacillus thermotolerans TaxID=3027807 RepID=UPI0023679363|nr:MULTISPECIES: Ada metal-binding domain-containing protein [unclassified Paenibacillus]